MEIERALRTAPDDLTAWQAVQRALSHWGVLDGVAVDGIVMESERAVAIAPDYGLGHALLATARNEIGFTSTTMK